jgi:uncharacterized membrane protein YheB (UPF0754 family)
VKTALLFAVPPLAGALIGFVTNLIAIKMLFRPLREIRVFGLRLPFTPGILPRQRHKLAASIGAMVERELLTPELLRQRLRRDDIRAKVRESLARFTGRLLDRPLGDFLDIQHMSKSVFELLGMADMEGRIEHWAASELGERAPRIARWIEEEAVKWYPSAVAACTGLLRRPGTRRILEAHGRIFLDRALRKLNVFQRLFFSAAQYDRTLDERMGEIIDDLINQVENLAGDTAIRGRAGALAGEALGRLLEREGQTLARLVAEPLIAWGNKPLNELLPALGIAADAPVGTICAVDGAKKKLLDDLLCSRLLRVADEQIGQALASIDVRALVSERIDSLEMLRVERIILDVMANQLKWINVFGAILGFLIGLFQVLCIRLFR